VTSDIIDTSDGGRTDPAGRPLIVAASQELIDELLRICAAAGTRPLVAPDPTALRLAWPAASVVLLGTDIGRNAAKLPRRPGVVVVGTAPDRLWDVATEVGASHVAMLPSAADWLTGLLVDNAPMNKHAPVLCVVGGQGGAGATTLAAGLARTSASQGIFTLLVDLDPFGGGIDLALGMDSAAGERWPQLTGEPENLAAMVARLPVRNFLRVLAHDRDTPASPTPDLVRRVLQEGRRDDELVVVDVPRSMDPSAVAAFSLARRVFLVVPAQLRAIAAAGAVARTLQVVAGDVQAVVRGPAASGIAPIGIARTMGLPLAGQMKAESGLSRDYDRGIPPGQPRGPLGRLCAKLLDDLGIKAERDAA
jgi:secretion/DNA translocation related CpaE-like protein